MKYAKPHWRSLTSVIITMSLGVAFELLKPWPTKILIDQVLGQRKIPSSLRGFLDSLPGPSGVERLLFWLCVATVLIYVLAAVMNMLMARTSVRLGQRMTFDLGADLFLHLQKLSLLFHSRLKVGDTVARVTGDPACVQVVVTGVFVPFLQAAATLILMAVIMWQLNPAMTLLALGVAPFLGIVMRMFANPMRIRHRASRDLEGQMMSVVEQTLTAIPVVQAFTREHREHARFRHVADQAVDAQVRAATVDMWFKLCVGAATALGTAGIMYLGGRAVLEGKMTVGTIVIFLAYLNSLYVPLNTITYMASNYQQAAANADRVTEILESTPDVNDAPDAVDVELKGEVVFDSVQFGYDPARPVLRDISLQASPGQTVALIGSTGAGKTTLVNLLARLADPQAGRITVDGVDLRTIKLQSLREQVSIVLQDPFIFPLSIAENIAYGRPDARRDDIVAAAIAARADSFIQALPDGYDTVVGERGTTLSGGEKQRISIARAFLKDAPILILDEPTSALDVHTEARLLEALNALMHDRLTFVIAHRLSTIRNADQILVLQDGRIVERGSHRSLLMKKKVYASLYYSQAPKPKPKPRQPRPATANGTTATKRSTAARQRPIKTRRPEGKGTR
ncbi:MAG: ABC transporter ATP-binding protein [Actinomycetes bacterium]